MNLNGNVYQNTIPAAEGTIDFPTPVVWRIERQRDLPWMVKFNNLFTFRFGLRAEISVLYFSEKAMKIFSSATLPACRNNLPLLSRPLTQCKASQ
jgi:hypothetical protein